MRIIDTHLHLIDLRQFRYPWLDDVPALNRSFSLDDYRAQALSGGVEAMLHMEVDVDEADQERETAWVTSVGGGVIGAIAGCRPENPDFPEQLERLAQNPKVRGLRRTFHFTPDSIPEKPLFIENIRRLAEYRLSYDICAYDRQLPIITRLAEKAPDVQFVLDHCGIPNVKAGEIDPWRARINALASLPNVACKVSGIVAYGDQDRWTVDDLRPYVEHVIGAFGWDRVLWGSDWPVCTQTTDLTGWLNATHALLAGTSLSEKTAFFSGNAERLYRLTGHSAGPIA